MKTLIDNAKISKMTESISKNDFKISEVDFKVIATDAKVKELGAKVDGIKAVPESTAADAGKVLTVGDDGSVSWQTRGAGGGMKAFFDAGGKCGYSKATSFVGAIAYESTSNVTNMSDMFSNCSRLASVPSLDTSNVTNMSYMFSNCSRLKSVPSLDTSNVTNMSDMFYNCSSLEEIHMINIKASFDIRTSTKFTREALVEILGNLANVGSTRTLTMGSTNLAKLTDEDKKIATDKGWTLA